VTGPAGLAGRDERRAIARETMRIVGEGFYRTRSGDRLWIAEAVRAAVAGTRHYLPHEDVAAGLARELTPAVRSPVVEVTNESTLVAARRVGESAAGLVFTSATKPGGGFLRAAFAEALAAVSRFDHVVFAIRGGRQAAETRSTFTSSSVDDESLARSSGQSRTGPGPLRTQARAGRPVDQGGQPLRREDAVAFGEKLRDLRPVHAVVEHHAHDVGAPGRLEERVPAGDDRIDLVAG
jgi:Microbial-type PARG, catalytic domain